MTAKWAKPANSFYKIHGFKTKIRNHGKKTSHKRPIKKLFEEKRHLKQYFIMAALYFSSESKLNYWCPEANRPFWYCASTIFSKIGKNRA